MRLPDFSIVMYTNPDGISFEDYAMKMYKSVKAGEFNAKAFIVGTMYKGSKIQTAGHTHAS
mgnify:CR=1 FL=1